MSQLQAVGQKVDEVIKTVSTAKDKNSIITLLNELKSSIDNDIQKETNGVETTGQIEEDVDMDIDQITQKPDVVKQLSDKKININLVDKDRNSTSSSSSSSISSI